MTFNPMLGSCGACLFYQPQPPELQKGRCLRNPPIHHFIIENNSLREACTWPLVQTMQVCGEFRPKVSES